MPILSHTSVIFCVFFEYRTMVIKFYIKKQGEDVYKRQESIQSTIFVQINGSGLGKIQIAGSIPPSQIPVSANRGRTSSQP